MYLAGYNKVIKIEIELYETASGHCPFDSWFESQREFHTRAKILNKAKQYLREYQSREKKHGKK